MSYSEIIINGSPVKLIPLGDCACGCGGKTTIAKWTNKAQGRVKGQSIKYINHHIWKNRKVNGDYPTIYQPNHLRAGNGYVGKHIFDAEKALGKSLPKGAVVHHHTPDQLVICQDLAYHNLIHQRKRAYEACGHADWRKCRHCHQYDDPINLSIPNQIRQTPYHIICARKYQRIKKSLKAG